MITATITTGSYYLLHSQHPRKIPPRQFRTGRNPHRAERMPRCLEGSVGTLSLLSKATFTFLFLGSLAVWVRASYLLPGYVCFSCSFVYHDVCSERYTHYVQPWAAHDTATTYSVVPYCDLADITSCCISATLAWTLCPSTPAFTHTSANTTTRSSAHPIGTCGYATNETLLLHHRTIVRIVPRFVVCPATFQVPRGGRVVLPDGARWDMHYSFENRGPVG